jgi:hypothetical protein
MRVQDKYVGRMRPDAVPGGVKLLAATMLLKPARLLKTSSGTARHRRPKGWTTIQLIFYGASQTHRTISKGKAT